MWTCPRDETINDDADSYCKICGKAKPIREEPRVSTSMPDINGIKSTLTPHGFSNVVHFDSSIDAKNGFISTKELREQMSELQSQANGLRAGVIVSMLIILILFAVPYYSGYDSFTIFNNIAGNAGDPVYTVCSIVLLIFVLLPAILILMDLKIRQRNLPITISTVSGVAATIYCCVIWFGNLESANIVPFLIILCCFFSILCSVKYVHKLHELDNLMFKPRMVGTL